MSVSSDLLTLLRSQESQVKTGDDIARCVLVLNNYMQALASERGEALPSPLPDATPYTSMLSRRALGFGTIDDVGKARDAYVRDVLAKSTPLVRLDRAKAVKARLDAAIAAKAPQATIDALRTEYQRRLAEQTNAAQAVVNTAVASGAPTNVVGDLQKRLAAAKSEEASGKLATSPMKEILTFAILTSPAWVPLLLMRTKVL